MTTYSTPKTGLSLMWDRIIHTSLRSKARQVGDQTSKRSWARRVENFELVPEAYRRMVLEIILDERHLPYAVLTPTYEGHLRPENEKLVFCLDHSLYILENNGPNVTANIYKFENIQRIEFGEILLKAWLRIYGTGDQGVYSNTLLCFNSVTDFLFNPIIEAIRRSDEPVIPVDLPQESEKFSSLASSYFKFMNYARNSLLPGEPVAHYFLQPEMETVPRPYWE